MFEDTITYSFVNLFTNEDVISRTTRVDYKLLAQNPLKAKAVGERSRAMNYIVYDVRREGEAGGSPALGFGIGNFPESWRELIQTQV